MMSIWKALCARGSASMRLTPLPGPRGRAGAAAEVREKEAEFKPRVEESLGCTGVASLAQVGEDSEGCGRGGC